MLPTHVTNMQLYATIKTALGKRIEMRKKTPPVHCSSQFFLVSVYRIPIALFVLKIQYQFAQQHVLAKLYATCLQLHLVSFTNYDQSTSILCKVLIYSGVADVCKQNNCKAIKKSSDDSFLALQFSFFSAVALGCAHGLLGALFEV